MNRIYRIIKTLGLSTTLLGFLISWVTAQELSFAQSPMASTSSTFNPQEFADAMTDFYKLLVDIGYTEHDTIHYAPHTDPPINLDLAHSLHLEPQVIELLELLPYPFLRDRTPGWTSLHILFESRAAVYIDDFDLKYARDPGLYDFEEPRTEGVGVLEPWEISLSFGMRDGIQWLLNTRDGTLQRWPNAQNAPPGRVPYEEQGHYEGTPPVPAVEAIRELTRTYRELDWKIPMLSQIVVGKHVDMFGRDGTFEQIRRKMIDDYGWPDNFRREAWRDEAGELLDSLDVGLY